MILRILHHFISFGIRDQGRDQEFEGSLAMRCTV
jgi:hypothetical protein